MKKNKFVKPQAYAALTKDSRFEGTFEVPQQAPPRRAAIPDAEGRRGLDPQPRRRGRHRRAAGGLGAIFISARGCASILITIWWNRDA
jgi:hypothetical protein